MKLLVIGSGMMGSAAAYDMARSPMVESVTLADVVEVRSDGDLAAGSRHGGRVQPQVRELEAGVRQPEAKRPERRGRPVNVVAVPVRFAARRLVAVADWDLAETAGNGEWDLACGSPIAEQGLDDRVRSFVAGNPGQQDRVYALGCPC